MMKHLGWSLMAVVCVALGLAPAGTPAEKETLPRACIDGTGPGWKQLGGEDFVTVNGDPDTWTWHKDGSVHCKGQPVGVCRTKNKVTNFEMVVEWKHLKSAGNSGVFVWTPEKSLMGLKPGKLPAGIEVQVLDHGYAEQYEKRTKKKPDWFTTNGDVFPVGSSRMKPFPPVSPNGKRSFPRKNLSKGVGQWNHYYIRAINGEVRLWVNGEEVSGGNGIEPRTGYLCLESEGSPIDFRNIRIRELP
jgi:3-keto-disaccharide hydrolase